ncbi:histidinol-phosphatase [Streptomyces spectabilis]|uniref:Histidinol-phosphatase n=1 Tax=Streptomyces spectabilis TaxID=68270 RepID=A0A5P2XHM4_STRST|nr:histidinol-phosphatase [Streptomyces spectabilis]MBB5104660.1 histidinol-phosphatase [Streptomyces spectabilis]MCI3904987.1 histidinol-phosphatase [Streptomyces spectabilis]QEV62016.1 histidinol-phosphatase [Streptomyces spectabilis]GGV01396.1 histidinol-phosphatase [Streptomyces spectabilis]
MPDYLDDLRLAHVLADAADAATMDRFKALDLRVETKPDMTPVSEADKAAEELIRGHLQRARPRDAILGEEYGVEGTGPRRWVIDPIDGTKNYVRGVPVWATLISLMEAGEGGYQPVVGVVSAPALGRRWWAAKGSGAFTGRSLTSASRLRVSEVGGLQDASFAYSSLSGWEERGRLDGFLDLTRACWRTRAYGDFWPYMLVAEGAVDICAEPELSLWDMAATAIVVTEAGGRFTGLDGAPGPHSGNAAASNGLLHDEMLAHLNRQ